MYSSGLFSCSCTLIAWDCVLMTAECEVVLVAYSIVIIVVVCSIPIWCDVFQDIKHFPCESNSTYCLQSSLYYFYLYLQQKETGCSNLSCNILFLGIIRPSQVSHVFQESELRQCTQSPRFVLVLTVDSIRLLYLNYSFVTYLKKKMSAYIQSFSYS